MVLQLPPTASETAMARAFSRMPEVDFAEVDRILPPDDTPNDLYFPNEWHLAKIAAPAAWDVTIGSESIIVAILDTGVDGTHPDLAAKMVPGWNTYDNNSDSRDIEGHGTETAGTATAITNNGMGVAAPARACLLMPVRISNPEGWASGSTAASGLTWAADHGARVANISYEVSDSYTVTSAAKYFQSKGGVVTISAGNRGAVVSLSDNPYVLTVGATGSDDVLASWSNRGPITDLVAPGVSIYTTRRGGGYGPDSGTSFSAPITAGVAALVLSANPSLSGAQVQEILKQSADDLGPAGYDTTYGWGRVNAARAVALAASAPAVDIKPPTVAITSPAAGATVSGAVSVRVEAADNVGVASVSLRIDGNTAGTATSSPYTFAWDTTAAADGSHTLAATAVDAAGNASTATLTVTVANVVVVDTPSPTVDITSPTVAILSPVTGSKVSKSVTVKVSAADDAGAVKKVELYVDGRLTVYSTAAPFNMKWNATKAAAGTHSLQCKAYDAAGNQGDSSVVTVVK